MRVVSLFVFLFVVFYSIVTAPPIYAACYNCGTGPTGTCGLVGGCPAWCSVWQNPYDLKWDSVGNTRREYLQFSTSKAAVACDTKAEAQACACGGGAGCAARGGVPTGAGGCCGSMYPIPQGDGTFRCGGCNNESADRNDCEVGGGDWIIDNGRTCYPSNWAEERLCSIDGANCPIYADQQSCQDAGCLSVYDSAWGGRDVAACGERCACASAPPPTVCELEAPAKPSLNAPGANARLSVTSENFTWTHTNFGNECPSNSTSNDEYRFELDYPDNRANLSLTYARNVHTTPNINFPLPGLYRWRVIADNGPLENPSDWRNLTITPNLHINKLTINPGVNRANSTAIVNVSNDGNFDIADFQISVDRDSSQGALDCSNDTSRTLRVVTGLSLPHSGPNSTQDFTITGLDLSGMPDGIYKGKAKVDSKDVFFGGNSAYCGIDEAREGDNVAKACYTLGPGLSCAGFLKTLGGNVTVGGTFSNRNLPPAIPAVGGVLQFQSMEAAGPIKKAGVIYYENYLAPALGGSRFSEEGNSLTRGWNVQDDDDVTNTAYQTFKDEIRDNVFLNAQVDSDVGTNCPESSQYKHKDYKFFCYNNFVNDTNGFNAVLKTALGPGHGSKKVMVVMPEDSSVTNAKITEDLELLLEDREVIVFTNRNLRFKEGGGLTISEDSSGVMFVVGDKTPEGAIANINIDPRVTRIDGVYLFGGEFDDIEVDGAAGPVDNTETPLSGNGMYLGLGDGGFSGGLARAPFAGVPIPGEEFSYQGQYLSSFANVITKPKVRWEELAATD